MKVNYEKFKTMSKEEYCKKYEDGLRFLFGYDICNKKDEFEMVALRVYLPKKLFKEYKIIEDFKEMLSLQEKPLFKEFSKQIIKVDFEKKELITPDFFIQNDIEIIPYFSQVDETEKTEKKINKNQFFELLKQNDIKELNYLCSYCIYGCYFWEEEYEYFCNQGELK
ncbi:hypothetical protein [Campylobacter sp. TTU-622]|uniref:hypothetical protein n=1 Tax=Campylobacter sp. TTU-622 TaxID=2800583 RepID=UPI001F42EFEA|nr:hypothetical protein [Campylobacter sp. TTU-622]